MLQEFKSPLSAQIEVTSRCPNSCIHCYNHWREAGQEDASLTTHDIDHIVGDLARSEVLDLLITGGEPMLNLPAMFRTLELAHEHAMPCSLNSNLTLATDEVAVALREFGTPVLTSVLSASPSVHDEITRTEGSFDRTLAGISLLVSHGVHVSVNMVVMKQNLGDIYHTAKLLYDEFGLSSFNATKVEPSQNCPDFAPLELLPSDVIRMFDELLRIEDELGIRIGSLTSYPVCLVKDLGRYHMVRERGCNAGQTGCTVGPDGSVRACALSDYSYGNLLDEPLSRVWPRLKEWRDDSLLPETCLDCAYIGRCSTGCRMTCKYYSGIRSESRYMEHDYFEITFPPGDNSPAVGVHERLQIADRVRYRREDFGVVVTAMKFRYPMITHDSSDLLESLHGRQFTLFDIGKQYDVDMDHLVGFFSDLVAHGIVHRAADHHDGGQVLHG